MWTFKMTRTCLIIAHHTNDIEVLPWIHLIISLCLCRLMYNTLSKVSEWLPWNCIGHRTISLWLFEANRVIHAGEVSCSGPNLKFFKIERLDLPDQRILVLEAIRWG